MIATEYDALQRIKLQTAPDGSLIKPTYNERGVLTSEDVDQGAGDITHLAVIEYDAKGQRTKVEYGNGVYTEFNYDENTFRLVNLVTTKPGNPDEVLQDLHYWYDAVGNITWKQDAAFPDEFYNNSVITAANEYTYDALYRLTEATGRENQAAINFNSDDNYDNRPHLLMHGPTDTMHTQEYTQTYTYDEVGNILSLQHSAGTGGYTRNYEYDPSDNRLKITSIGAGPPTYNYGYHMQHGFITSMPHLPVMAWNWKEELCASSRQVVGGGQIPETTYYQYDSKGKRLRKITENFSPGPPPQKRHQRIYIEGYEFYKHFGTNDTTETLSLIDNGQRFVMIENSSASGLLTRYIHPNHQGSCTLETDDNGDIITYEEYHPFGTTAYQATNSNITASAKRYRYTGMERDDETGLSYHNARYYIPWLGRWLNPDPIGIGDGVNVYGYCWNNPSTFRDLSGMQVTVEAASRLPKRNIPSTANPPPNLSIQQTLKVVDPNSLTTANTPAAVTPQPQPDEKPTPMRQYHIGKTALSGGDEETKAASYSNTSGMAYTVNLDPPTDDQIMEMAVTYLSQFSLGIEYKGIGINSSGELELTVKNDKVGITVNPFDPNLKLSGNMKIIDTKVKVEVGEKSIEVGPVFLEKKVSEISELSEVFDKDGVKLGTMELKFVITERLMGVLAGYVENKVEAFKIFTSTDNTKTLEKIGEVKATGPAIKLELSKTGIEFELYLAD